MKKQLSIILLGAILLLAIGCVDYKAYEVPQEKLTQDNANIQTQPITGAIAADVQNVTQPNTETIKVDLPDLKSEDKTQNPQEVQVIKVKENDLIRLKASIKDPDQDPVNYSFSKPLSAKGEWKTSYGDAGEYLITLTASDGKLTTAKDLKLMVQRVNIAPIIEDLKDLTFSEGELVNFSPKVKDPNNDPVTVTVSDPLKEGTFKTDHTSSGDYRIKVTATDGELKTEKNFLLKIVNVNVKPQITNVNNLTLREGELVKIKPIILDLDENPIKTTISEPVGDDGQWQTKFTDHGDYVITITANDGVEKITKQIKLEIVDVNMAPEIISVELQK